MINCMCVIQEGQTPDQMRGELHTMLEAFSNTHFNDSLQVNWLPVAEGSGFTAGEPSTSSVVSITANQKLEQSKRESLLRELVSLWTDKTGCTIDEVVAVVSDPA